MEQEPPHASPIEPQRRAPFKVTFYGTQHCLCRLCALRVVAIGLPIAVTLGVQLLLGRFWRGENLLYSVRLFPTRCSPVFHGDPDFFHLCVCVLELLIDQVVAVVRGSLDDRACIRRSACVRTGPGIGSSASIATGVGPTARVRRRLAGRSSRVAL